MTVKSVKLVVGSISPRKCNIYLHLYYHFFALVSRQSAALSSATPPIPDFDGKWGSECLNTSILLPTLLCAGYSVKLFILNVIFLKPILYDNCRIF